MSGLGRGAPPLRPKRDRALVNAEAKQQSDDMARMSQAGVVAELTLGKVQELTVRVAALERAVDELQRGNAQGGGARPQPGADAAGVSQPV